MGDGNFVRAPLVDFVAPVLFGVGLEEVAVLFDGHDDVIPVAAALGFPREVKRPAGTQIDRFGLDRGHELGFGVVVRAVPAAAVIAGNGESVHAPALALQPVGERHNNSLPRMTGFQFPRIPASSVVANQHIFFAIFAKIRADFRGVAPIMLLGENAHAEPRRLSEEKCDVEPNRVSLSEEKCRTASGLSEELYPILKRKKPCWESCRGEIGEVLRADCR